MITLDKGQVRMIYLVARMRLEFVIAQAEKKHHGLSSGDEAAQLIHDLETAGLIDASVMNGQWWTPKAERDNAQSSSKSEDGK